MKDLDPVIREVAEAYKFEIKYCDVLDRWSVQDENFYWDDSYSKENFFEELRQTFIDEGVAGAEGW